MSGWIKLHRQFTEWEWYDDDKCIRMFIHLLLKANHKDKNWRGMEVKRGEYITSIGNLANETGMSQQTIRTVLKKLEKTSEINRQSTNKLTKISICNYATYQGEENETNKQTNKQLTSNQQTTNKQLTTTKECKNDKNDNNEKNIGGQALTKKTIEDRVYDFKLRVLEHKDKYSSDMLKDFFYYWSEVSDNGKKMKCEMERTFNTAGRLATWKKNSKKFNNNQSTKKEQITFGVSGL